MKKHILYLRYLLRHKWFVFIAGRKYKAPLWRLVIHDWSKFLPCEWFPYVEKFYGNYPNGSCPHRQQEAFNRAWLHHQHANPHHWEHWVLREDNGATKVLQMPEHFAREMVSDWAGAGRAITGRWEVAEWYVKNSEKILLHERTRTLVEGLLGIGLPDKPAVASKAV